MKIFTLLIASQRSGSTRFRQDLSSLRGVGDAQEYALKLFRQRGAIADKNELIQACRCDDRQDGRHTYALKLMLNYSYPVLKVFRGFRHAKLNFWTKKYASVNDWLEIIEYLNAEFDEVLIFLLTRGDIYEISRSRALAQITQTYHVTESLESYPIETVGSWRLAIKILLNSFRVRYERRMLENLNNALGQKALRVTFETLTTDPSRVERDVQEYLTSKCVTVEHSAFDRDSGNQVIVDKNVVVSLDDRQSFVLKLSKYLCSL